MQKYFEKGPMPRSETAISSMIMALAFIQLVDINRASDDLSTDIRGNFNYNLECLLNVRTSFGACTFSRIERCMRDIFSIIKLIHAKINLLR